MMTNAKNHNQPQSASSVVARRDTTGDLVGASFRFRRWSRAGYAVFRSLSICVTIGKLSSDICEKAFCKLKGIIRQVFVFVFFEKNSAEDENPDEYIEQYRLEKLMISSTTHTARADFRPLLLLFS